MPKNNLDSELSVVTGAMIVESSATIEIALTTEQSKLAIDVHGDLAGILAIVDAKARPAGADGVVSHAKPVAGTRGHHNLLKQKGRPRGAADVDDIAQQVKLVAGVGFEPTTFRL